jgi:AcrR family transcriptional regulator
MIKNELEANLNQYQLLLNSGNDRSYLKKGDRKKLEIIEAAIDCLATEGIDNTTFDSIAKRIDTRRAHVAYHFKDKHMIFEAAISYILITYEHTLQEFIKKF